jgi:hypothetical protein
MAIPAVQNAPRELNSTSAARHLSFQILDILGDKDSQIDAGSTGHAYLCILSVQKGVTPVSLFFKRDNPCIFLFVKDDVHGKSEFLDLRVQQGNSYVA